MLRLVSKLRKKLTKVGNLEPRAGFDRKSHDKKLVVLKSKRAQLNEHDGHGNIRYTAGE